MTAPTTRGRLPRHTSDDTSAEQADRRQLLVSRLAAQSLDLLRLDRRPRLVWRRLRRRAADRHRQAIPSDDTTNSDTAVRAPGRLASEKIAAPAKIALQSWDGKAWQAIADASYTPATPTGRRANVVTFSPLKTSRLRAVLTHAAEAKSGLSEFEASGPGTLPCRPRLRPWAIWR